MMWQHFKALLQPLEKYLLPSKCIDISIDVPDFFFRGGGQADPLKFRNFFTGGGPGGKQGVNRILGGGGPLGGRFRGSRGSVHGILTFSHFLSD